MLTEKERNSDQVFLALMEEKSAAFAGKLCEFAISGSTETRNLCRMLLLRIFHKISFKNDEWDYFKRAGMALLLNYREDDAALCGNAMVRKMVMETMESNQSWKEFGNLVRAAIYCVDDWSLGLVGNVEMLAPKIFVQFVETYVKPVFDEDENKFLTSFITILEHGRHCWPFIVLLRMNRSSSHESGSATHSCRNSSDDENCLRVQLGQFFFENDDNSPNSKVVFSISFRKFAVDFFFFFVCVCL